TRLQNQAKKRILESLRNRVSGPFQVASLRRSSPARLRRSVTAANNLKSSVHLAPEDFLLGSPAHAVTRTWLGGIAALAHCHSYSLAIVGCPCRL
ncbi:hypothetical protein, partial [Paraburkholderia sp. BR14374]|uniref:hypothetical protein n=1 Tax=Paraburkholderia sp. BR14374 TaxID=3237007 RepID=UPI0034CDE75A